MIDKEGNKYVLYCDSCSFYEIFDDFYEAIEYKKSHSWKSKKIKTEWIEYCDKCKERGLIDVFNEID